jgi:hypothetical protein
VIQVIFRRPAFEQMNRIIQANRTRAAEFATALQELTAALTSDPAAAGESRELPYRVIVCGQLTFRFRPAPDEGRAYVVRVRLRRSLP